MNARGERGKTRPHAAPFKRDDQMREILPIGVTMFPGNGILNNLVDKAKKLGIPVRKFATRGAG